MTGRLLITGRCIKKRVEAGEKRDTVLAEYRLLSDAEKQAIINGWDTISTAQAFNNAELTEYYNTTQEVLPE